jgi:chlorobactene glucosyltransferase
MNSTFWIGHQNGLVTFLVIILCIWAANVLVLRRLSSYSSRGTLPSVSILLPARNEEANIGACLRSLLAQDYPSLEVLVLDDGSTDDTARIIAGMASEERLRVIKSEPLPEGWLGKNWACHQLAAAATGELLLFTDADTRHTPGALRLAVAGLQAERSDLLTLLVHQETVTWAEKLVIPVLPFCIMSFFPLPLVFWLPWPILSVANGQFMLFCRSAYDRIGGHAAVRREVVDDLALARRAKALGLRVRIGNGIDQASCRMYRTPQAVFDGLGKNLFGVFDHAIIPYVVIWVWLGMVFLEPWLVVGLKAAGVLPSALSLVPALKAIALAALLWLICLYYFRFPLRLAFVYPFILAATIAIAVRSLALTLLGRSTWKERTVVRQRVRWL